MALAIGTSVNGPVHIAKAKIIQHGGAQRTCPSDGRRVGRSYKIGFASWSNDYVKALLGVSGSVESAKNVIL